MDAGILLDLGTVGYLKVAEWAAILRVLHRNAALLEAAAHQDRGSVLDWFWRERCVGVIGDRWAYRVLLWGCSCGVGELVERCPLWLNGDVGMMMWG